MTFSKLKKILATTIVISSIFVVSGNCAQGQIRGTNYSRGGNVPLLNFDLVFKTINGGIIDDKSTADDNLGLFVGAIESFSYSSGSATNVPSNSANQLGFSFTGGNLSASKTGNIVKYTIIATQPFALFDDDEKTLGSPFITINPNPVYTFDLDISGFNPLNQKRAVNDLKFITENNLYSLSNLNTQSFVSSTFNGLTLNIPNEAAGLTISKIPDKTIPEPSLNIALLTLGLFGTRAILKRKLLQN